MPDNISYIHNNKLAKYNYKYIDKYNVVYIGQKDGRLKKLEGTTSAVETLISSSQSKVSISPNAGTGSTIIQDTINPFLLMGS